jgi:hypothetical protein
MPCKSFNIDQLTGKLKGVNPVNFDGASTKIKSFQIDATFNNALPDINSKVSNAIENFKNISTGSLPTLNIPNIDPTAFFEKIDSKVDAALISLKDVRGKLNVENLKAQLNLDAQLDCINADTISTEEVAITQSGIFENIKGSVGSISNNQLRDFNLDPNNQVAVVNNVTSDTITKAKEAAAKGVTNAKQASNQKISLDKIKGL